MRFSTPISSVPISSKGDVGIREGVATGVASDLFIKRLTYNEDNLLIGDASEEGFLRIFNHGAPPGYADFVPFIEGYYDYQTALYKMAVQVADGATALPEFSKLEVVVDVADVIETGKVVTDPDVYTRVKLNKKFYTVPTVTGTQLSGDAIATVRVQQNAVNVANPGNEYFYIALVTQSGDLIKGNVYWQAIGY